MPSYLKTKEMKTKFFFFIMLFSLFFFESKGGRNKVIEGDSTRFDLSLYDKHKVLSGVLLEHVFSSILGMGNERLFAGGKIYLQCLVENSFRTLKIFYNPKGIAYENMVSVNFIFKGGDLMEVFCDSPRYQSIKIFWALKNTKDIMLIPLINLGFSKEELISAGINPDEEYSKEYYLLWKKKNDEKEKISKALQEEKIKKEREKTLLSAEKIKEMKEAVVFLTKKPAGVKISSKPITISINKKAPLVFEKGEILKAIEKVSIGKYNPQRGNYGTLYFSPHPFRVDFELHPEGGYIFYFYLKEDKEEPVIAFPLEFILKGEDVFWASFKGSKEDLALILTILSEEKILKKGIMGIPDKLKK